MKYAKLMVPITLALFVVLTPAFAQDWAVRANIPFDFTVGQQTLSAGDYRVSISGPAMIRVARIGGPDVAGLMTAPLKGVENVSPRLVFHRYGKHYFLAQVWVGELNLGHQMFASAQEVQLARTTKQEQETILAQGK